MGNLPSIETATTAVVAQPSTGNSGVSVISVGTLEGSLLLMLLVPFLVVQFYQHHRHALPVDGALKETSTAREPDLTISESCQEDTDDDENDDSDSATLERKPMDHRHDRRRHPIQNNNNNNSSKPRQLPLFSWNKTKNINNDNKSNNEATNNTTNDTPISHDDDDDDDNTLSPFLLRRHRLHGVASHLLSKCAAGSHRDHVGIAETLRGLAEFLWDAGDPDGAQLLLANAESLQRLVLKDTLVAAAEAFRAQAQYYRNAQQRNLEELYLETAEELATAGDGNAAERCHKAWVVHFYHRDGCGEEEGALAGRVERQLVAASEEGKALSRTLQQAVAMERNKGKLEEREG